MGKVGWIVLEKHTQRRTGTGNGAFGYQSWNQECRHNANGHAEGIEEEFHHRIHEMRQSIVVDF